MYLLLFVFEWYDGTVVVRRNLGFPGINRDLVVRGINKNFVEYLEEARYVMFLNCIFLVSILTTHILG